MNAARATIDTILRKLDFDDLLYWAGEKMVNRAKSYVQHVDQLACTEDNTLVAWVTGTERYATSVRVDDDGSLHDFCTCPYSWGPCKHAVAVVLAAAERVKAKQAIPLLDEGSDLGQTLLDDAAETKWIDDEQDVEDEPERPPKGGKSQAKLGKMLGHRSHDELLQLLIDLSARFPEVRQYIVESEQLASGQVGKLVRALRSEIRNLTTEPAWYNHWRGEGHLPDYSHLEDKLRALADRGYADAVLQLGDELWVAGNSQVEQSDDEGETAMAIAPCLDVVLAALPRSSLSPPDQLLWLIDRALEDEYSLLNAVQKVFDQRAYTRSHWQEVSRTLETRLHTLAKSGSTTSPNRYRRGRLLNALLDAYARAGWKDRIIPRLEDEADVCQCYPRLVDELLSAGERERARQWCIQGYARTAADAPGFASTLQERLRKMAEEDGREDLVAAYRAQDFFCSPSNSSYNELRKAAEKAKSWPAVRAAALQFLETGERPGASTGSEGHKIRWPLPAPEVAPTRTTRYGHQRFPDLETLIKIAISEERFDDVVGLYSRLRKAKRWGWDTDKTVASAVASSHPDLALAIWTEIVNSLIKQVKPKAYEEAAAYLRFMRKVYVRDHRLEDWRRLLEGLRREHKAKRRLMAVLDALSNKKLVD
jgi:uncharacterized Zn finger protein